MLLASALFAVPVAAFAQTDSGGGAASEDATMKMIADVICDQGPYTNQSNTTTGEKTGPMQLDGVPAAEVLANHYSKEWTIGGRTFYIRKVVALPYQFDTSRNGQNTGKRRENLIVVYAGSDGP